MVPISDVRCRAGFPVFLGIIFAFSSVGIASAWTGPTQAAPNGNTATPVNVSATSQVKAGSFWAAAIGSDAGYCIGASCISVWPTSPWTLSGTNLYYTGGNVGIGTNAPRVPFEIAGPIAAEALTDTSQAVDNKTFDWFNYGGVLRGRAINDAYSAAANWVEVYRSGTSISKLIFPNGNVGIGTPTPVSKFHVAGTATFGTDANATVSAWSTVGEGGTINLRGSNGTNMFVEGINGTFRLVNSGWTAQIFSVDQVGNTVAAGNVTAAGFFHSSDARLKDNIATSGGLDIVSKLRGVTFDWKKDGTPSAGVIAQEVEQVMPSAVHTDASGMKTVEYDQLIAPLIQSIKEQQAEINDLKQEVHALKAASK